jgi:hypothetical protein
MPQITVKSNAPFVGRALRGFAEDVARIPKGKIYGRLMAAKKRISKYPALWRGRLPKNWFKSDKQRRYVMMLVRQGKVPYRRTGAYMDAWVLESLPDGYRLTTKGPREKAAQFIGGNAAGQGQAKIHQGRWGLARPIVDEELDKLPKEIDHALTVAGKRRGL